MKRQQADQERPVMISISLTAARDLDPAGAAVMREVLTALPPADRYVTGGARGGDAFAGRQLYQRYPGAEHYVIVPANRSQVDPWWEDYLPWHPGLTAIGRLEMPPGTTYRDRNIRLVTAGSWLQGFPAYPEDDPRSARSGSWQTLRLARRAGKPALWQCVKPPYASGGGQVPLITAGKREL